MIADAQPPDPRRFGRGAPEVCRERPLFGQPDHPLAWSGMMHKGRLRRLDSGIGDTRYLRRTPKLPPPPLGDDDAGEPPAHLWTPSITPGVARASGTEDAPGKTVYR
jgi:hypothetical protein